LEAPLLGLAISPMPPSHPEHSERKDDQAADPRPCRAVMVNCKDEDREAGGEHKDNQALQYESARRPRL